MKVNGAKRPKVSIISTNLSTNCTNRCVRLAQALNDEYDVEIVGTTFGVGKRWGEGLWPPIDGISIPIRTVRGDYLPGYLSSIWKLLSLLDGDIIIACKPRFPSLGIALIKKLISGKLVLLDVDDDELAQTLPGKNASFIKQLVNTSGYLFTRAVHPFWKFADGVFTVSEHFRSTYGGVIVPHGRDPDELDPGRYDRVEIRGELNICQENLLIGFVGSPQYQKGIDLILQAIQRIDNDNLKLLVIGAEESDSYLKSLRDQYGTMMLTIPFLIYGIFRYLYVIHIEGNGGAPDEVLLTDRPLQATVGLFGFAVVVILYLA